MKNIKTNREYYLAMAEIEQYLAKGFNALTEEEDKELEKLSKAVHKYEQVHFPMPVKHDITVILEAYMKEHKLSKQGLASMLEVGNSTLSEIMNKKRPMSFDFAKKLHSKMHLDGNLILEIA